MRFVTETGQVIPVYQQVTALIDEQLIYGEVYAEGLTVPQALAVSRQLIDESQAGSYAAVMTQFHVDYYLYSEVGPWVDGTMAYAAESADPDVDRPALAAVRRGEGRHHHHQRQLVGQRQDPDLHRHAAYRRRGSHPAGAGDVRQRHGGRRRRRRCERDGAVARRQRAYDARHHLGGRRARNVAVLYGVPTPEIAIGDVTVTEGHAGTTVANLPLTLSSPSSNSVTVNYQTVNGTATQPGDYQSGSGTITFAPFATSRVVPVTIVGDLALEPNETLLGHALDPHQRHHRRRHGHRHHQRRRRAADHHDHRCHGHRRQLRHDAGHLHRRALARQRQPRHRAVRDGERHRDRRRRLHRRQRYPDVQSRRHVAADYRSGDWRDGRRAERDLRRQSHLAGQRRVRRQPGRRHDHQRRLGHHRDDGDLPGPGRWRRRQRGEQQFHRQFVDRLGRQRRDGVDQLRRVPLHRRHHPAGGGDLVGAARAALGHCSG